MLWWNDYNCLTKLLQNCIICVYPTQLLIACEQLDLELFVQSVRTSQQLVLSSLCTSVIPKHGQLIMSLGEVFSKLMKWSLFCKELASSSLLRETHLPPEGL